MSPPSWLGGFMPGGGAPPPPLNPIPGMDSWYDATNLSNTNSSWVDQSGNGNPAVSYDGVPPILTQGAVNGLPAYLFDYTLQNFMATNAFSVATNNTMFVVFQAIIGNPHVLVPFAIPNAGLALNWDASSGNLIYQAWSATVNGYTSVPAGVLPTCISGRFNGTNLSVWYGQELKGTNTGAITFVDIVGGRTIGAWSGAFTDNNFNGYICEILNYPVVLSDADVLTNQQYLMNKWNAL